MFHDFIALYLRAYNGAFSSLQVTSNEYVETELEWSSPPADCLGLQIKSEQLQREILSRVYLIEHSHDKSQIYCFPGEHMFFRS